MEENTLQLKQGEHSEAQILVVEDEEEIRELISLILLRQGCRVQQCTSVRDAEARLSTTKFDLIILDWMLPQQSGLELVKVMQKRAEKIPILMVTAKAEPENIVEALELGADDYITKPFEPQVFTARVRALLRRGREIRKDESPPPEKLHIGELELNLATYEVKNQGEVLHLTPSEFKILVAMAEQQGRVLTRDRLISVVQGDGISVTGRTIDTHVFGLRKKLGTSADSIETIRGVGYRIRHLE